MKKGQVIDTEVIGRQILLINYKIKKIVELASEVQIVKSSKGRQIDTSQAMLVRVEILREKRNRLMTIHHKMQYNWRTPVENPPVEGFEGLRIVN